MPSRLALYLLMTTHGQGRIAWTGRVPRSKQLPGAFPAGAGCVTKSQLDRIT